MPRVTIRTGFFGADGQEEELSEFLCDAPGCPNTAINVLASVKADGIAVVVCADHAAAQADLVPVRVRKRESSRLRSNSEPGSSGPT
jgi:hypothetical protein